VVETKRYERELAEAIERARVAMNPRAVRGERWATLCPAEVSVMKLLSLGFSNFDIADAMGISGETVRTYLKRIYDKCYIEGRSTLVAVASRLFPIDAEL